MVVSREGWEAACRELGADLHWSLRGANLVTEGVEQGDSLGQVLRINKILRQITGQTDPCRRMDEAKSGLLEALGPRWRGGVPAHVLSGGTIALGAQISRDKMVPGS